MLVAGPRLDVGSLPGERAVVAALPSTRGRGRGHRAPSGPTPTALSDSDLEVAIEQVITIGVTEPAIALLAVAFVAVAGLWWAYFDWVHGAAEARLVTEPDHTRRSSLARDLFTLGHLPIVAGTVVFAVAIEEALLHPSEPLNPFAVTAVAVGPALYLSGFVLGNLRATGRILSTRLAGLIVIVAIAALAAPHISALASTAAVAAAMIAIAAIEGATHSHDRRLANSDALP
jgi:low temperature requirement protein LtrA